MRKFRLFFFCALALVAIIAGCDKPRVFVEEGQLSFDVDTVKFDSIFTTFQAPSERLIVTNNTNKNVRITRVWLEDGASSEFSLIVDGIRSDDVEGVELAKDDSLHIFVTFRSELKDMYAEEYINFQVGGEMQKVLIRAKVIDGYLFRTTREDSTSRYLVPSISSDTTFTPEKLIVFDGPLVITNGATLTIQAGTRLFFTPFLDENFNLFSFILVRDGSLKVSGEPGNPVVFQGTRFDSTYMENPAQWRGIWFGRFSRDNVIEHAVIKNGLIGLRVDSTSFTSQPKLTMRYSEVRNMGAYGVWGLGFSEDLGPSPQIVMENCLVNNCSDKTLIINGGGNYEFYNCTFGNFAFDFNRRTPQISMDNYFFDPNVNAITFRYDLRAQLVNSVIWGSEEEELLLSDEGLSFDVVFNHSLVRTSTDPTRDYDYSPYFLDAIENEDPLFNEPREYDYRPKEGSPVINKGLDLSSRYSVDIRDNSAEFPRNDASFDLGAYEYYEIE